MDFNSSDFFNEIDRNEEESVSVQPDKSGILINSALAAYELRDYRTALKLCDEILDIDQSVSVIWKFKGQCLYYLKRYSEAVTAFDSGLKISGSTAATEEMFFWKILTLYHNKQYITARQVIKQYLDSPSFLRTERMTAQANEVKKKVDFELRGINGFFYRFKKIK